MTDVSRIHIVVESPEQWNLLAEIDYSKVGLAFEPERLAKEGITQFLVDTDQNWFCKFQELNKVFEKMCKALTGGGATNCTIICDTIYVYPFKYYAFWYKNGKKYVDKNYLSTHGISDTYDTDISWKKMMDQNPISDVHTWMITIGAGTEICEMYDVEKLTDGYKILSYKGEEEIVKIPVTIDGERVIELGEQCFAGKNMSEVIIPPYIKSIGSNVFENCRKLQNVFFDHTEELISLPAFMFAGCGSFKELFIPRNIEVLDESVLYGCPLEKIIFPVRVKSISKEVFSYHGEDCLPEFVQVGVPYGSYAKKFFDSFSLKTETKFQMLYLDSEELAYGYNIWEEYSYWMYQKGGIEDFDIEDSDMEDFNIKDFNIKFHNMEVFEKTENPEKPEWSAKSDYESLLKKNPNGIYIDRTNIAGMEIVIPEMIEGLPVYRVRLSAYNYYSADGEEIYDKEPKAVYIPKTVKFIEADFMNIVKIQIDPDNPYLYADETGIYSKDKTVLYVALKRKDSNEYVISDSVKRIDQTAFKLIKEITKITIGASVESFYEKILDELSELKEIAVSEDNIQYTSDGVSLYSKDRSKLVKVPNNIAVKTFLLSETVKEIDPLAFGSNNTIEELVLTEKISQTDDKLFSGCKKLKNISLAGKTDGTDLFLKIENKNTVVGYTGRERKVVIPEGIKYIACHAFTEAVMEEIEFPEGLLGIESYAFEECENLKSIHVPETVYYIGKDAFKNCKSLEYAVLPANVYSADRIQWTRPKSGMFYGCEKLRELRVTGKFEPENRNFPDTYVEHEDKKSPHFWYDPMTIAKMDFSFYRNNLFGAIGNGAFDETSLWRIVAPGVSLNAIRKEWQSKALLGFIEAFMRGEEVEKSVETEYFEKMDKQRNYDGFINNVLIMKYVTQRKLIKLEKINSYIELASREQNVEVTAMLIDYKNNTFSAQEIAKLENKEFRKAQRELDAPVNPEKKKKSSKAKVIDKSSPEYIKKVFPAKTDQYWPHGGDVIVTRYKGEDAEIEFPVQVDGQTIAGIGACGGVTPSNYAKIEKVVIPQGYKYIGARAFKDCTNLKEIIIPDTVEEIGDEAFCGCTSLKKLILPDSVKKVGKWALRDSGIKELYVYNANLDCIGTNWLRGMTGFTLYAPEGSELASKRYGKNL